MSTTSPLTPAEASLFQKYAPTILSGLILVVGGLQALTDGGFRLVPDLVFAALVITTLTTFHFTGWWKVGLEVAGVLVAVALPFAVNGTLTASNGFLIAVAVLKALATQFGVVLRADSSVIDARAAQGVPSVTNVTYAAPITTPDVQAPAPAVDEPDVALDTDGAPFTADAQNKAEVLAEAFKSAPAPEPVTTPEAQHASVPLERPANSARIAEWIAYAEQFGYDHSSKFTKAALIAQFGDLRVS